MTNYGKHIIPSFEDDVPTIKEFVEILLNTIFYHRWLGINNYSKIPSKISNISYIKLQNDSLQNDISNILSQIDLYSINHEQVEIVLDFYTKQTYQYFFLKKNTGLWETWIIPIIFGKNGSDINKKEKKVRHYFFKVLEELNQSKDFMPDLNLEAELPEQTFPYEIKVCENLDGDNFLHLVKNMALKDSLDI